MGCETSPHEAVKPIGLQSAALEPVIEFGQVALKVLVRRVKALVYRGLKVPPGNWFAPPGSNRSGSGGNEAAGASGVEGRLKATRQVAQAVM